MRVSVYGVNVAASNGRPRPAFPDTPIMPRCELTRRIADGGGTKVKSPQGKPLTINTSILGSLASPASPLSTPNDRKCPFDGAQCQMDGICFLNTQRAFPHFSGMRGSLKLRQFRPRHVPPREIISQRESNSNSSRRDPSFPHPSNLPPPFLHPSFFSSRGYIRNIFSTRAYFSYSKIQKVILLNITVSEILFREFRNI